MSSKVNSTAPKVSSPAALRNVVLVGSAGSGKTTLFENLIKARVEGYRGDKDDAERAASLTLATITNGDVVINLLDAPGQPDFVGELRAGLAAASAAIFVVSAADGIDSATASLWRECEAVGMPRAVVVSKLDTERAEYEDTLAEITEAFGPGVQPAYMPLYNGEHQIIGNLSLLSRMVHDYSSGDRVRRPADSVEDIQIDHYRADYIESVISYSESEDMMERYLEGEELATEEVVEEVLKAMAHGGFFPVLPVMTTGPGTEELIGLITRGFPSPLQRPLPDTFTFDGSQLPAFTADPDAPLRAQVIRTTSDPYAGRLSMVRVFSGTIKPDLTVVVSGNRELFGGVPNSQHPAHQDEDRVGPLSAPSGVDLCPKTIAIAGEIVYVAKLAHADTTDTIASKDRPALLEPWVLPEPMLPTAFKAASHNDEDKLPGALQRLLVEDATVKLERAKGTDQQLLWTMGQAHRDLVMERLNERYGVNVATEEVTVPLLETFIAPARAKGRHVKQSGGHGQYAVCDVDIEPLPRGTGFEFVDQVVGGAVPRQFIPSVEKGVRAQLEKGTLTGFPMTDVRVTLFDGKAHSVDSSDMAFQSAGAQAIKDAATLKTVGLLEPFDEVAVTIDDEYVGAVMTDISNRRGQVQGTDSTGSGQSTVKALVPANELNNYAIDLRGLARGTGSFTRSFHGYELMPTNLTQEYLSK